MTWVCQAGVKTANLIIVIKNNKITPTETRESVKLGIDAHVKWYYVARQLDGVPPQPVQKMVFEGLLHFVPSPGRVVSPNPHPLNRSHHIPTLNLTALPRLKYGTITVSARMFRFESVARTISFSKGYEAKAPRMGAQRT